MRASQLRSLARLGHAASSMVLQSPGTASSCALEAPAQRLPIIWSASVRTHVQVAGAKSRWTSGFLELAASASIALTASVAHCKEEVEASPSADPKSSKASSEAAEETSSDGHLGRYFFLSKETRQRIFFLYEKRVRDFSALEKVFDYFSSQERDGVKYMNPADLLHSVVATYPPSTATGVERAGSLDGESTANVVVTPSEASKTGSVFEKIDTNGDGLVSYHEFLLLITLLRIMPKDAKIIFDAIDKDGDGSVTVEEFREIINMLNSSGDAGLQKAMANARAQDVEDENLETGLFMTFFGKDLRGKLKFKKFSDFLKEINEELVHLEFCHYLPPNVESELGGWFQGTSGWIPAVDFARTLVLSAEMNKIRPMLRKIDKIESELKDVKITYPEFKSVHLDMQRSLADLAIALTMVGSHMEVDEFNKLCKKIVGVQLSDKVLEIIDLIFGDDKGIVDVSTFLECLQRRGVVKVRV